jgi:predicted MFS family arabinose efflux permease
LVYGVAGTAIAFTTSFGLVLGLRALRGIGFAGIVPVVISSIGDIYTGTHEATAQALRFTSTSLTQALAPLIAGLLVAIAWQFLFFLYSIAVPIGVAVWIWFDEPMPDQPSSPQSPADQTTSLIELARLVARPKIMATIGALFVPMIPFIGFVTYNSFIVVQGYGGSPGQAGLLLSVLSVVLAVSSSQAGRITNRWSNRFVPLAVSNLSVILV